MKDRIHMPSSLPCQDQFPDLRLAPEFDPDNLTAADVLKVITVALAATRGSGSLAKFKAQSVMEEQWARGRKRGLEDGRREGYSRGYLEGLEDGRREALDRAAAEEAERASLKAAARARRS